MRVPMPESVAFSTVIRHIALLPLWVVRNMLTSHLNGPTVAAIVALDVALALLHHRATRIADRADPDNFGTVHSWTKLLYVPELLAAWMTVGDGLKLWHALRQQPY